MQIRFGDFVLDTDTRELTRDSRAVHLSPKAFQLLAVLVTARPRALSKETLYQHLWPNTFVVEANLSNLIGELRAAIGDEPRRPRFVRTVHGFGYAFREALPAVSAAADRRSAILYQLVWEGGRATFGEGEHVLGRDPDARTVRGLVLGVASPRAPSYQRRRSGARGFGQQEWHFRQREEAYSGRVALGPGSAPCWCPCA